MGPSGLAIVAKGARHAFGPWHANTLPYRHGEHGMSAVTQADHTTAAELATAAGAVLIDVRGEGLAGSALKAAGDQRSQAFLAAQLNEHLPADAVLSEEAADDPSRLGR